MTQGRNVSEHRALTGALPLRSVPYLLVLRNQQTGLPSPSPPSFMKTGSTGLSRSRTDEKLSGGTLRNLFTS